MELNFELPVGLVLDGERHRNVELLQTNGVAEQIITKKLPEKPFTWQGNIISCCVKSIGDIQIGAEVRKKYLDDGAVTIPSSVMSLPLSEVNTLLVEIHRRVWMQVIPRQEVLCKYCGKKMIVDIDLERISMDGEGFMKAETNYNGFVVKLVKGFNPPKIEKLTDREEFAGITDTVFNQMRFRVPTLRDAINNEKYFSDSITFWRRIAMDCLVAIEVADEEGNVTDVLPKEFHTWYGLKIFNEILLGADLKKIRDEVIECLPTLPFAYEDTCPHCAQTTPMVMEASSFFSE